MISTPCAIYIQRNILQRKFTVECELKRTAHIILSGLKNDTVPII